MVLVVGGLGDVAMILVIGGVGLYALYAYNQGALGTGTTTGTTEFIPGESYVDPTTGTGIPATNATCQQQGGIWQGICCSCPNNDCDNKCGKTDVTGRDVCVHEGGLWEPLGIGEDNERGCCRCPNLDCSDKCGAARDPSGGKKSSISPKEGLCMSEGGTWDGRYCVCPNRKCQNKKPSPLTPQEQDDKRLDDARKKLVKEGSTGDRDPKTGVPKPITPAAKPKMSPNEGLCRSEGGKWNGKCCTCPNQICKNKCTGANYAHSYLAGSSNRLGPGYTHRDDFRHPTNVEFPAPTDFLYEATYRPFYLGNAPHQQRTALRKRFDLNANAKSNFSMRFSG